MQWALLIAINLHVLSVITWAGFTFALARTSAAQIERLFLPQMGAAFVGVASGSWLWSLTHEGRFGPAERVLAIGVIAALLALLLQVVSGTSVLRRSAVAPDRLSATIKTAAIGQRIAAALLAFTALTMASDRFL
jgi:hypothetical protein